MNQPLELKQQVRNGYVGNLVSHAMFCFCTSRLAEVPRSEINLQRAACISLAGSESRWETERLTEVQCYSERYRDGERQSYQPIVPS